MKSAKLKQYRKENSEKLTSKAVFKPWEKTSIVISNPLTCMELQQLCEQGKENLLEENIEIASNIKG